MVDLDAFERNLKTMSDAVAKFGVKLRGHSKTHKCPIVARRQMALGAVGACCQKVGEAEAMVHGGVTDVLVSNQIVGRTKLRRLCALASLAKIAVCADDAGNVEDLNTAAVEGNLVHRPIGEQPLVWVWASSRASHQQQRCTGSWKHCVEKLQVLREHRLPKGYPRPRHLLRPVFRR